MITSSSNFHKRYSSSGGGWEIFDNENLEGQCIAFIRGSEEFVNQVCMMPELLRAVYRSSNVICEVLEFEDCGGDKKNETLPEGQSTIYGYYKGAYDFCCSVLRRIDNNG